MPGHRLATLAGLCGQFLLLLSLSALLWSSPGDHCQLMAATRKHKQEQTSLEVNIAEIANRDSVVFDCQETGSNLPIFDLMTTT